MSFLSILKTVGEDVLKGEQIAAPFIGMLVPAAAAPLNALNQLVIKAEQTYTGEKQGATKKQVVVDEFNALFPMFQSVLKDQAGLLMTFDASQVGALVDATVAQFNAAKALHDTFKISKV